MIRAVVISVALLATSGCAVHGSKYGCKGHPDGVNCVSVHDVYKYTENRDHLNGEILEQERRAESGHDTDGSPQALDFPMRSDATITPDYTLPIRTPAQVMRIWVSPWVDVAGDLNMSGYVYTEVEPRKWTVGEPHLDTRTSLHPLQIQRQTNNRD